MAKKTNNPVTAYSPIKHGLLGHDKNIKQIAGKYNKTPAQIILRWLIQLRNMSVIPKAASEKHRIENISIFDFELSDEDMESMNHNC